MAKGWNLDYLNNMSEKYKNLSENEENLEMKSLYEKNCEIYKMLSIKLLFQDGNFIILM